MYLAAEPIRAGSACRSVPSRQVNPGASANYSWEFLRNARSRYPLPAMYGWWSHWCRARADGGDARHGAAVGGEHGDLPGGGGRRDGLRPGDAVRRGPGHGVLRARCARRSPAAVNPLPSLASAVTVPCGPVSDPGPPMVVAFQVTPLSAETTTSGIRPPLTPPAGGGLRCLTGAWPNCSSQERGAAVSGYRPAAVPGEVRVLAGTGRPGEAVAAPEIGIAPLLACTRDTHDDDNRTLGYLLLGRLTAAFPLPCPAHPKGE